MIKDKISAIDKLSKQEKLLLAVELWDEVFREGDIELTKAQKKELDQRIEYARQHPDEMISWNQVRDDIKEKYGS